MARLVGGRDDDLLAVLTRPGNFSVQLIAGTSILDSLGEIVLRIFESHPVRATSGLLECRGRRTLRAFARVLRLQATIRAIDRGVESLAQLAVDSGFADQAHATREVQRLTGLTPARLRAALRCARDDDRTVELAAAFVRGTT